MSFENNASLFSYVALFCYAALCPSGNSVCLLVVWLPQPAHVHPAGWHAGETAQAQSKTVSSWAFLEVCRVCILICDAVKYREIRLQILKWHHQKNMTWKVILILFVQFLFTMCRFHQLVPHEHCYIYFFILCFFANLIFSKLLQILFC